MSTIINASTSSGLVQTADTSGTLVLQSNGTSAAGVSGNNFQADSGYGTLATVYGCRAWVNFDGTRDSSGAASTANTNRYIRASGNVASVLRNSVGNYTVTFTNAMPDGNYCVSFTTSGQATSSDDARVFSNVPSATITASSVVVRVANASNTYLDVNDGMIAIFR